MKNHFPCLQGNPRFSTVRIWAVFLVILCCQVPGALALSTFDDFNAFQSNTVSLILENFDDTSIWNLDDQTPYVQPVMSQGVHWTASEELISFSAVSRSSPYSITSLDDASHDIVRDTLMASFSGLSADITAVGSWVGSHGKGNDVELVAFGEGDIFLGTVVGQLSTLQIGTFCFIGLTSDVPITRVEFRSSQDAELDDFSLDDFYFGQAVPIPPSALLLGFGMVALVGLKKKFGK